MKKNLWKIITILIVLTLVIGISVKGYNNVILNHFETNLQNKHKENYDLLVEYTDRINKKEEGVGEELEELAKNETDYLKIGTYKNALSYYYLNTVGYEEHKKIGLEAIEAYKQDKYGVPLIIETYVYLIRNSVVVKDYDAALTYSFQGLEMLDEIDNYKSFELFAESLEVIINCNLINIYTSNDVTDVAKPFYDRIKDLKPGDPIYDRNEQNIIFAKLIYQDEIGNYEEAENLAFQYHEFAKKTKSGNIEGLRINLAVALIKNDKIDESYDHIVAAENHYINSTNIHAKGTVYLTYGEYYYKKGDFNTAFNMYNKALSYYQESDKLINDVKNVLEKIISLYNNNCLSFDIKYYIGEYLNVTTMVNNSNGIAELFNSLDSINYEYYQKKVELEKKQTEILDKASKDKVKLIIVLSIISILFIISTIYLSKEVKKRKEYEGKLLDNINHDYLTGAYSRGYGIKKLKEFLKDKKEFSIALIDIDNFKTINDNYGHQIGDNALKVLTEILTKSIGSNNYTIRYGGEEFLIILNGYSEGQAVELLNNIREEITNSTYHNDLTMTISVGVRQWQGETLETLVKTTDELLYKAKNTGKNRVCN